MSSQTTEIEALAIGTKEENRFEVGNISYDHNGNILTLHRNGLFRQLPMEAPEYGITDQLSYHYKGNRLMAVNDAMDTPQESKSDFRDNGSKGDLNNPEYRYDANGNMTWDGNKGITVTYNHLNLPKKVDFGNGKYIEYTYDATGTKLQQKVHDGQNPVKQTDYVGGMVYEDGQLQFVQHGEGRIVMVDNDGLSKLPEYQYHLRDHLGNVRLTFSAEPETESSTATLEAAHEDDERAAFLRYDETTKINAALFDHTGNGDTHYAIRLNGTANERKGLAKSLAVMTGDTIRAEVFAKYLDPDQNNWTTALQNLMAAIAGGTAPVGTVIEAIPPSGGDGFPFAGLLDAVKAGDTGPQAYLNILVFDENLTFIDGAFAPVTTAAMENGTNVPHEKLAKEIVVQQPGYVYIYFSNDNDQPLEVFFDDFTVTHAHSAIVQADDYYPFGMTFNGYRRENGVGNRYKYQGKELQQEVEVYDFEWRGYDPVLGLTWQMDPHAENYYSWSPYSWTFNNPINIIDPDGRDPVDPRTGRQVNLNLYRSSVYSQSSYDPSRHRVSRDATLYSKADPFFTRKRNAPDGLWVGAASFKPVPLLNYTSKDAIAKLGSLYNKSSFAGIDYGAPNDYMWRKVADQGTYAYIDDSFSRTEIFKPSSFNVVGVEENYITSIVNLSAEGKSNYNINSVTTFGIEKGEIQTRTKSSFFGLITTEEQFRTLNVTETTTIYNNNQVTDNITTKEYQIEEIIK